MKIAPDPQILKVVKDLEVSIAKTLIIEPPPVGVPCKLDREIITALREANLLRSDIDFEEAAKLVSPHTRRLSVALHSKALAFNAVSDIALRGLKREAVTGPALKFAAEHISKSADRWRDLSERMRID